MHQSMGMIRVGLLAAALAIWAVAMLSGNVARANEHGNSECAGLPAYNDRKTALEAARDQTNGGFNLDMWGTVVNRDGIVCAVAFTGTNRGSQSPGSRLIS